MVSYLADDESPGSDPDHPLDGRGRGAMQTHRYHGERPDQSIGYKATFEE